MEDPFSIHAESDMQTFEIEITYNPKEFPKSMSDLVAAISNIFLIFKGGAINVFTSVLTLFINKMVMQN